MLVYDVHRRTNYKHFKQDEYPTKEKIQQIIKEGFDISPKSIIRSKKEAVYWDPGNIDESCQSREFNRPWRIEVYGPEHLEDKKKLVLESGSRNKTPAAAGYECQFIPHSQKVGVEQWEKDITKVYEEHPGTFNEQIIAPYFCHLIADPHEGDDYVKGDCRLFLELGILLHSIASVANAYEVDFAFCKCYSNYRDNPILRNIKPDEVHVTSFAMGYYDWSLAGTKGYDCYWRKTDDPDVIRHPMGGLYNTKDCTRVDGSHHRYKPEIDEVLEFK